ncbi:MAG TPA: 30S ribosomal protein S6 [Acidimicrobiales bacterium]|nr:30S ribosomal protein S6 [Acidimicrobiales bacterium]
MRPYEVVIIFDTEVEESAITAVLERGLDVIRNNGGTVGTVDRWGKRTLAYEIQKKREGYYVVAEFTAEPKAAADLDRLLVLADEVLRHKIMRVPDEAIGASTRPKTPVRSAPSGDRER